MGEGPQTFLELKPEISRGTPGGELKEEISASVLVPLPAPHWHWLGTKHKSVGSQAGSEARNPAPLPPPADFQGVKTSVQHLGVPGWVTWRVGGITNP